MKRKVYCDYLRVIATLAVIVLHVSSTSWRRTDVNGMEWQALNLYDSVVRWAVPVFVMISGSLFLNREISVKKIYCKYILRIVIAFFVWSVFYALTSPEYYADGILNGVMMHSDLIVSGHFHMWFLLMLIGIYMCIPFYKKIVSENFVMKYFLVLSFVFTILIPWGIKLIFDYAVGTHEQLTKLVEVANSNVTTMGMYTVMGYSFYFVLGYYLDSVELSKKHRVMIYILGAIGFVFTIVVNLDLALKTQQPCDRYYNYFDVNILLEAVCVHTLIKYQKYKNEKINSFILIISGYSFGGYLIHAFFIEKFSLYLGFSTLSFNTLASVPVVSGVVIICAMLVSAVLNNIPIIKKYCV